MIEIIEGLIYGHVIANMLIALFLGVIVGMWISCLLRPQYLKKKIAKISEQRIAIKEKDEKINTLSSHIDALQEYINELSHELDVTKDDYAALESGYKELTIQNKKFLGNVPKRKKGNGLFAVLDVEEYPTTKTEKETMQC